MKRMDLRFGYLFDDDEQQPAQELEEKLGGSSEGEDSSEEHSQYSGLFLGKIQIDDDSGVVIGSGMDTENQETNQYLVGKQVNGSLSLLAFSPEGSPVLWNLHRDGPDGSYIGTVHEVHPAEPKSGAYNALEHAVYSSTKDAFSQTDALKLLSSQAKELSECVLEYHMDSFATVKQILPDSD